MFVMNSDTSPEMFKVSVHNGTEPSEPVADESSGVKSLYRSECSGPAKVG